MNITSDTISTEHVNRTRDAVYTPNGKGLNVSFTLKHYGIDSKILGFFGGFSGDYIVREADKICPVKPVQIDGITRVNVFLTTPEGEYKFPNAGAEVNRSKQEEMLSLIRGLDDLECLVVSGSTTLAFLHCLAEKRGITVITNDVNGLIYVEQFLPQATPACTGGILGREYRHFAGPMVASSLSDIYLDKVFLGADAFEPDFGFLAEFERTATTKVEFMRHARKTIILMDASKVGAARSFVRFATPTDVDTVIMDKDPGGIVTSATTYKDGRSRVVLA